MPRNDGAGILDLKDTLDHRFEEIPCLAQAPQGQTEKQAIPWAQSREKPPPGDKGCHHAAEQSSDGPLDAFIGTDGGIELMPAQGYPGKICRGVARHDNQHNQKDPFPAERQTAEQNEVGQKQWNVTESEQQQGKFVENLGQVLESKQKHQAEKQEGQCHSPLKNQGVSGTHHGNQQGAIQNGQVFFRAPVLLQAHAVKLIQRDTGYQSDESRKPDRPCIMNEKKQQGKKYDGGQNPLFNGALLSITIGAGVNLLGGQTETPLTGSEILQRVAQFPGIEIGPEDLGKI